MQKEIQLTDKTLLVVGLEENHICSTSYMGYLISKYHNLDNGVTEKQLSHPVLLDKYLAKHKTENDFKETAVKLPKGDWQLLGIYPELTEEQAQQVVLTRIDQSSFPTQMEYYDYMSNNMLHLSFNFETALESFQSLIERENITGYDKYAILIKSK